MRLIMCYLCIELITPIMETTTGTNNIAKAKALKCLAIDVDNLKKNLEVANKKINESFENAMDWGYPQHKAVCLKSLAVFEVIELTLTTKEISDYKEYFKNVANDYIDRVLMLRIGENVSQRCIEFEHYKQVIEFCRSMSGDKVQLRHIF